MHFIFLRVIVPTLSCQLCSATFFFFFKLWPIAPVALLEEYLEALFSFHPLVAQAILFIVVPILGPISSPKRIFGVTHLEPGYHGDT
ncbi:hypothetical protein E2C01_064337 [Portunus trituberculatus]|uniref:Uncharacterized protein n=1 Tax=Portunus trituberculatus TaxID=210409 RepID=A0A5B7HK27_PORTR|nr:hypothetical protein [Portunus trituberculatus]